MKIIPLCNDNNYSLKLFYLENIDYLNIEKIIEFNTLRLNCYFSYNYLEKLLNVNKCCIIIFNDLKLFISKDRYFIRTSKLFDGYKLIYNIRNNNYIKYLTNLNSKFEILNSLFEECKFYLDSIFDTKPFTNLINIINILYIYNDYDKYSSYDKLILERFKFKTENYLKLKIKNSNLDNISKILKVVLYLENKNVKNKIFKLIVESLEEFKFENSLFPELLEMISLEDISDIHFNNLLKLIEIEKKSKNLLIDLKFDDVNIKSIELYSSVITRTNWIEELNNGNIMGLLINVNPKNINKNGYNLDYVPISEITHTIIGFDQILEAYKINNSKDSYENILSGYGIGKGNCILLLYINYYHWNFVKLYLNFSLGIIFNRNPLFYHNNHKNIYKNVLINMINLTFSNENFKSDKWLNLLFSVLRTNYELFSQNYNSLNKFIVDKKFRITCSLNNIILDYLFSKDEEVIKIIFEELIRRTFKSLYKNIDILDSIYIFTINSALQYESNYKTYDENNLINISEFNKWIHDLELNPIFSEKITLIYAITKMKDMIDKHNILKKMDDNYGILDNDSLIYIKSYILNMKIVPENGDLFGLLNPKFESHLNFTKDKIFSIKTFIDLKLVENINQLYNIFIQGILQRVDKCRKKALDNNKVQNPFIKNDIIKNAGLLISQRYIKNFFGLSDNFSYLNTINIIEKSLLPLFIKIMVKKTISVKKYIKNEIENINLEKRELVKSILEF